MDSVDLTAYPVLRLDQIGLLDNETLNKAIRDVVHIIETQDDAYLKIMKYLNKQHLVMTEERIKRTSQSKMDDLLVSAIASLESNNPINKQNSLGQNSVIIENNRTIESYKNPSVNITSNSQQKNPSNNIKPEPTRTRNIHEEIVHSDHPIENRLSKLTPENLSELSKEQNEHLESNFETSTPRSTASSTSKRSRQSSITPIKAPEPDIPSKRSVEVVYRNFGSSFIVAATEKKKRFFPKKIVEENPEEIKNRERQERRKLAMEKLMKRREERARLQIKLKEERRVEKLKQKQKRKNESNNIDVSSSDSESVSGGDEDKAILVDKNLLENFVNSIKNNDSKEISLPKDKDSTTIDSNKQIPKRSSIQSSQEKYKSNSNNISLINASKLNPKSSLKKKVGETKIITQVSQSNDSNIDSDNGNEPTEENEFERKNMAALMMIRKLKEERSKGKKCNQEPPKSTRTINPIIKSSESNLTSETIILCKENHSQIILQDEQQSITEAREADIEISKYPIIERIQTIEDQPIELDVKLSNSMPSLSQNTENPPTKTISSDESLPDPPISEKVIPPTPEKFGQLEIAINQSNSNGCEIVETPFSSNELFMEAGNTFICRFGPDQLPGLRPWVLNAHDENSPPTWTLNLSQYDQQYLADEDATFVYRSGVRRFISKGLVALCYECEDILLGKLTIDSKEDFVNQWLKVVFNFDNSINNLASQPKEDLSPKRMKIDEDDLFSKVSICGNGYAVCKKIEDLLTYNFGNSSRNAISGISYTSESSDIALDSQPTLPNENNDNVNEPASRAETADTISSDQSEVSSKFNSLSFVNDQTPSDGIAIVLNEDLLIEDLESNLNVLPKQYSHDEPITKNDKLSTQKKVQEASKQTILRSQKINSSLFNPSSPRASRLVDIYPNFGMIFPFAYTQLNSNKGDSSSARSLIESMQLQVKLYEEWVEVMRDYSTVFCALDDIEESYLNGKSAKERSAEVYKGNSNALHYRVKSSRNEVTNIITDAFNKNFSGIWENLPTGLGLGLTWNLLWTWSKPHINRSHLLVWQRVNHFEDSKQLTRKDLLKRNLARYSSPVFTQVGINGNLADTSAYTEFEIMPQTFLLPHEYTTFVQAFTAIENQKLTNSKLVNYWIVKPIGLSRGRGISLIKDLNDLVYSQASVIQKYVENPLCLNNFKFDLRIYVVVTSFKPLEAFIYKEGFARISTVKFDLDPNNINNKFIHLTNSSIQKYNMQAVAPNPINSLHPLDGIPEDTSDEYHSTLNKAESEPLNENNKNPLSESDNNPDVGGSKMSFLGDHGLWKHLSLNGMDSNELWKNICQLVVKSLVVVDDKMVHQPCCFELFGYDVLIDDNKRPWLIEVNASPSLARENALDFRVKNALIADIISLLDVAPYDREALAKIIRKRLNNISKNRYVYGKNDPELESDLKAILGDYIPRRYGELPKNMGNFERLCPETKYFQNALKLKKRIIRSLGD